MKPYPLLILFLSACLWSGCDGRRSAGARETGVPPREFTVRGSLRELPTDGEHAVIKHEAIPGFMPAMTMTFTVKRPAELRGLTPGDRVEFRLIATDDDHWIESLRRIGHDEPAADDTATVASTEAELRNGDLLPDVDILSETGATNRFSDFRGRAVALTFVFTRCPLPDFCPRLSKHFSQARKLLLARTGGPTNWQFLSLSFDPEHDTPAVLAAYARNYRTDNADRWLFGVLDTNTLAAVAPRLDLRLSRRGGSISHNLRTVVLDPRGRIHRQFDGNEWTPGELADALAEAARVSPP
jgi:protein SCO1